MIVNIIDKIIMSKYYEFKNSKIRQLLTINDLIKTINIIYLNRIFNDEIFQIFTILNQMFIKIIKIIKILIIQIKTIKVIKLLTTINLIIQIKIVNKIKIDTQTSTFC